MNISTEVTTLLLFAICGVTFIIAGCVLLWVLVGVLKIAFAPDPEPDRRPGYFAPDDPNQQARNIGGVGFMISQQRTGNPQFPSALYPPKRR
jgi:hypothetical protein